MLVVALVSRRVNLSVHPQFVIQKPLRINTKPQLQSFESHHALASPTQPPHHLPDTHLERMFVNMCSFSKHQDWDSIIATTCPPVISTNPPTQIWKTTLDYPCTRKVYIFLKNLMDVIPWSESKPVLKW